MPTICEYVDTNKLFRLQTGGKKQKGTQMHKPKRVLFLSLVVGTWNWLVLFIIC